MEPGEDEKKSPPRAYIPAVSQGQHEGTQMPTTPPYVMHPNKEAAYYTKGGLSEMLYKDIQRVLQKFSPLDICFVCDLTGSMDPYIASLLNSINAFIDNVEMKTHLHPRMAFVGFRDKGDAVPIVVNDFTSDLQTIKNAIGKEMCYGGGDACEDIVTPLRKVLGLNWQSDLMFVFLLIDSPTHGTRYHTPDIKDDYKGDDATELLEKLSCHYRKHKISLVILKCNSTVDMMIEVIKKYYNSELNELAVVDLAEADKQLIKQLNFKLEDKMTQAFKDSYHKNFRRITKAKLQRPDPKKCDFSCADDAIKGAFLSASYRKQPDFEAREYEYKLSLDEQTSWIYQIAPKSIGKGVFMKCYFLKRENQPNQIYVAKVPYKPIVDPNDLLPGMVESTFTELFAEKFNEVAGTPLITVIPVSVLEVPEPATTEKMFAGTKYILTQEFLQGKYKKYNNNYGWVNHEQTEECKLAQAFSHFTYEASNGSLLIVDIQGVVEKNTLTITDPAIHTILYKGQFGETNCEGLGILKFFATHQCNDYCKQLMLTNPKEKGSLTHPSRSVIISAPPAPRFEQLSEIFSKYLEERRVAFRNFNPATKPEIAKDVSTDATVRASSAFSAQP